MERIIWKRNMKKEKICDICGKPFDYSLTIRILPNGKRVCVHDGVMGKEYFSRKQKKSIHKDHY